MFDVYRLRMKQHDSACQLLGLRCRPSSLRRERETSDYGTRLLLYQVAETGEIDSSSRVVSVVIVRAFGVYQRRFDVQ